MQPDSGSAAALTPTRLPHAGAGYPVTLTEAARRLNMTPDHVVDMVRAHCLTALLVAAYETTERPPLRFDPDGLDIFARTLSSPPGAGAPAELRAVSEIYAVAAGLRRFLAEVTPTDSETRALAEARPLLAHGRGATIHAHVRETDVVAHAADFATGVARVRLTMTATVTDALERLGCRPVRGIRPVAGGQSWKNWWRVPVSIWSLEAEDALRVDDFPVFGGADSTGLAEPEERP
jgi:hypothetical protein